MPAFGLFESVSVVEGIIYGFIASNMLLSGTFLLQRGVERMNGVERH